MSNVWLDRLAQLIVVVETLASDTATSEQRTAAAAELKNIDRAMGEKTATTPAAGGPAGATRQLLLLGVQCVASRYDEAMRGQLRAAVAQIRARWFPT